jgi:acetyl-CoA C-acetyltransferase
VEQKIMHSWIVSGARTPIGRFLGELSHLSAPQLAGAAIRAALERLPVSPVELDEVIIGQVLTAGVGQAPARQAALKGGVSDKVGCATVNKVCGSGLYSVMLADRAIRSGDSHLIIAGGMESMSQAPHLLRGGRTGWKYGATPLLDAIEFDGLTCPHGQVLMGKYAEKVAVDYQVSRADQDQWALQSHQRAVESTQHGAFQSEIVAVLGPKGEPIAVDGSPRADSSLERLTKLKPVFDGSGSVTAGNASSLSDGAAAVVVCSDAWRQRHQPKLAFKILGTAVFAAQPSDLFIAPADAIQRLLERTGIAIGQVDLFEINEAFASQTVACMKKLSIDPARLNIHGGAIALGHPIGCSGTRVLVTLMHALEQQQKRLGVAALCLGGGEAVAVLIERHST